MNLANKTIWVTGASSGIGEFLAKRLAREESRLILSARRESELRRVESEIKSAHPKADIFVVPFDLGNLEQIHEAASMVLSSYSVDILINNGGISQRSLAVETTLDVFKYIMDVNYLGTVALTKEVLPQMIKNKNGMVVTITSVVGKVGTPFRTGYAASKHALHGFFDSLRTELYKDHVRILLVTPGFVKTGVSTNALTGTGEKHGVMDDGQKNGIAPDKFANIVVQGIKRRKNEILVGRKEALAVYVHRFFPGLFRLIIRKAKVR